MHLAKLIFTVSVVAMSVLCTSGVERITIDAVISHYPWDGKVDCVCTVSGLQHGDIYKGAFTLSVQKDGFPLRRAITNNLSSVGGVFTNTFDCAEIFGEGVYPNGGITVDLIKADDRTGLPIGIKGDVLVIDVSGGNEATTYPTQELVDVDIGTFNCGVYKTDKIVLLKVPAGVYYCQPGADSFTSVSQKLTTAGFYIGVFPVTQRQYERVMGTNPSYYTTDAYGIVSAYRPVESVSWNQIRGSVAVDTPITAIATDSFVKRVVEKTKCPDFDLPTEAQWEIACRGGAFWPDGAYWNGSNAVELTCCYNGGTVPNIGDVAWLADNTFPWTRVVGAKRPNLWGLYDMQGNVWEWCRDAYADMFNMRYADIPYVLGSSSLRIYRGGAYYNSVSFCTPSYRGYEDGDYKSNAVGFRLSRACK